MAAWLAGLLALAHAGYDHSFAETYQRAQQLTRAVIASDAAARLAAFKWEQQSQQSFPLTARGWADA
eukprot:s5096_g10.t1